MATPHLALTRLEDRLTPTSIPPTLQPYTATGSGAGSRPMVQLLWVDGSIHRQFFAFDPGFTGGVSVAVADVNGDGTNDVIAAAGAGGGPHVKVFDGRSLNDLPNPTLPSAAVVPQLKELASFYAYAPTFGGGVSIAAGDVDGDGNADVITGAGPGGGPHVKAFSGKTLAELRSFYAFDPNFRGGVNVAAGEMQEARSASGREMKEIIVGSGAGMPATVRGFNSQPAEAFFSINPYNAFRGGVYVSSADFSGDGFDDLVTGAGAGAGPHITAYDGFTLGHLATILLTPAGVQPFRSFYAFDAGFRGGVRVAAGDADQNGTSDILAAAGPGADPRVRAIRGDDLSTLFSVTRFGLTPGTTEYSAGVFGGVAPNPVRPVPV